MNDKLGRFAALTASKKDTAHLFMGRELNRRKKWVEARASKAGKKLSGVRKICFVGPRANEIVPAVGGGGSSIEVVSGPQRAFAADVAVVDDIFVLSDPPSLRHVLAVCGRGLPVITRSALVEAEGRIDWVPAAHVLRHVAVVWKKKVVFEYDSDFLNRRGNIITGLRHLAGLEKSKWKVRAHGVGPAVGGDQGCEIVKLLGEDGTRGLHEWLGLNRRIINSSGSKVWSSTGPVF